MLRYLRAFLVLYHSLKMAHGVDSTRKISPFIDPFPEKYVLRVLDREYSPDTNELIDDYLDSNATRNLPLDLLPIFADLDEARVRSRLPKEKINPRPTLHYRLPNSSIDDPRWSILQEWKIWKRVEAMASDPVALERAMRREHYRIRHPWRARLRWLFRKIWSSS